LAVGARNSLLTDAGRAFQELKEFSDSHVDWMFGHFGYDLKNETENLKSSKPDGVQFPDLFFFVPEIILRLEPEKLSIGVWGNDAEKIFDRIQSATSFPSETNEGNSIQIKQKLSRQSYVHTIQKLKEHIHRGDCYEINFCQEFFAENVLISPLTVYNSLVNVSPNPFSAYYRVNDQYLMCASPERYLKKTGTKLLSQPIKGTSGRNEDVSADQLSREKLLASMKEKSENVMIVDLVRNDLSKICKEGSVKVEELFGVYAFPQVYQMISTVAGEMEEGIHWVDAIRNSFPMGSMTGAPKKRVMELIEEYEQSGRGIFSGALGYVSPEGF
jgi:para-aminobenzoate synthetase component 1